MTFGRCNPTNTSRMATCSINISLPNISIPIHLFEFECFFFIFVSSRSSSRITRFCYSPNRVCGRWANAVQTISNAIHWLMKRHWLQPETTNKVFIEFISSMFISHLRVSFPIDLSCAAAWVHCSLPAVRLSLYKYICKLYKRSARREQQCVGLLQIWCDAISKIDLNLSELKSEWCSIFSYSSTRRQMKFINWSLGHCEEKEQGEGRKHDE